MNQMKCLLQSPTIDTKSVLTLLQQPVKISQKSKLFTISSGKLDYAFAVQMSLRYWQLPQAHPHPTSSCCLKRRTYPQFQLSFDW